MIILGDMSAYFRDRARFGNQSLVFFLPDLS